MPIFEEKLISPLAIRFSQQRIRTTFQDGHEVEATIKDIMAGAGVGDYDVVLEAPFPTIEIIRWSASGRGAGRQDHWFTFDNRRLYCLQRVAAEYWPKSVAVKVEVVYSGAGTIRKNFDARTQGLSVSIDHALPTDDHLDEWAWQDAVEEHTPSGSEVSAPAEGPGACVDQSLTSRPRRRINSRGDIVHRRSKVPRRRQALSHWKSLLTRLQNGATANDAKAREANLLNLAEPPSCISNVSMQGAIDSAAHPQGSVLTSLIGQLLDLKVVESVQSHVIRSQGSCSTHPSCGSNNEESSESELTYAAKLSEASLAAPPGIFAAPPGIFYPEVDEVASTAGKGSLSGLIGQLLQTYNEESTDSFSKSKEASTAAPLSSPPGLSKEASTAAPLSCPPGRFEHSKVRDSDAEFTVERTPPFRRIKPKQEAQAEYMAKMMHWQRAQLQAKQMAQFQALQRHQAMSLYAARAAHAAAYSRRSQ